ncbi:unnamed protein product [Mytilus coruscus]|uniref:DDE Tnp4 domain-containing protein n=1 Tax=Mytilus coruscus TaxID=42192 RepID=A0A6J8BF99_MYTCO|nr:unnamed protein product [Mytilus coruscus]
MSYTISIDHLHIVWGNGPTEEYPDPIPAGACEAEKEKFHAAEPEKKGTNRPSQPYFEAEIELKPGDEGKVPDDIDTTIFTATPLPVETTGITPSGSFCFLSKLWSGAVSDRRITQASGFLEMLEFGDEVMADRGFTISDLLALKGATLAIPPFANGRQLSSRAVTRTRRIANACIHVERAIGDIKSFQALQGTLPLTLKPILDDIIFVCGALCNLRSKLVK